MFTTTYPTRKKPPPHPKRAEVEELGYEGVLKKYGSYWKAAEALGVAPDTVREWAPPPDTHDRPRKGWPPGKKPETRRDPTFPDLPPRAAFCLHKIIDFVRTHGGKPPTRREIAFACGLSSTNAVQGHLQVLIREGYVVSNPSLRSRDFKLTDKAVPPLPREDIAVLMRLAFRVADRHETMLSASRVLDWLNKTKETP